jgi:hypothetical protein
MIYRLPFQDVQSAVFARLREAMPGVQVVEEMRINTHMTAKYVSVGMLDAAPDHAFGHQAYSVILLIYARKADPKGAGHDAEIYALADSITSAMSTMLTIPNGWAHITPPWFDAAQPSIIEDEVRTAQIALTYRITVQKLPDTP